MTIRPGDGAHSRAWLFSIVFLGADLLAPGESDSRAKAEQVAGGRGRVSQQECRGGGDGPSPPADMKLSHLGTALTQLQLRPLKGTSLRLRERGPGEKPLISDPSSNLFIEQQGCFHPLPESNKSSAMTMNLMNLAPNASPGMADIPEECPAG